MKRSLLPIAIITFVIIGCSSAYKTGQTPDDVYYSPSRPQPEWVSKQNNEDRYEESYDDRLLRMRMNNRRWQAFDDYLYQDFRYSYFNNPWALNSPWTPIYQWNNFYNPYFGNHFWGSPIYPGFGWGSNWGVGWGSPIFWGNGTIINNNKFNTRPSNAPRAFNLNTYGDRRPNYRIDSKIGNNNNYIESNNSGRRTFNVNRSDYNDNFMNNNNSGRRTFDNNSNSGNRSFNSGSNSGGSNNSGGGSAPVRKF